MKQNKPRKTWKAKAILYTKKNSLHIIEDGSEQELYFRVLKQMYPHEYEIINVTITRDE